MRISGINLQTTMTNNRQKQNQSKPAFGIFSKKLGYEISLKLPKATEEGLESLQIFAEQTRLINEHPLPVTLRRGMIRILKPGSKDYRTVGRWNDRNIMSKITGDLEDYRQMTTRDQTPAGFFYGPLKNRPQKPDESTRRTAHEMLRRD